MGSPPASFLVMLYITAGLSLYLMGMARRSFHFPGAKEFYFLSLAIAFYTSGYALEISHTRLEDVLRVIRIEYLGIAFTPPLILLTTIQLARPKPVPLWLKAGLFIVPLITLTLVFTLEHHSLYYIEPRMVENPFFIGLTFQRGVWYWVHLIYQLLAGVFAPLTLLASALHASPRRKASLLTMGLGVFIPFLTGLVYALELTPKGFDPVPFSLLFAVIFFAWAVLRGGLFDVLSQARDLALDAVQEGLAAEVEGARGADQQPTGGE